MVGSTNCTLHNNQVTQGPKRIVDARYHGVSSAVLVVGCSVSSVCSCFISSVNAKKIATARISARRSPARLACLPPVEPLNGHAWPRCGTGDCGCFGRGRSGLLRLYRTARAALLGLEL
eukprot:scaffold7474_cov113-Isochrysis_galbana.AAC.10